MKIKRIYTSFFLITALFSCAEQDIDKTQEAVLSDQEIYFEVSHVNNAWGAGQKGFLIDKTGAVRTYSNPAVWNVAKDYEKGALTPNQIKENITKTVVSDVTVDAAQFKTLTGKIPALSTSTYTKRIQIGADMGQTNFYAYRYDAKAEGYVPVLLSETGDWQSQNTDKSAVEISEWLKGIQSKIK